ncbi:MAG TPA: phosphoribosylglycinamide formyltransferase [Sedimentisphaerales bacterium]|nr:phosphoribosylglycinamide formyltransferase [Sedimentisphaerales bacterium]HRS10808.1 phosphoribosylglycinamide formyltransferase [Sedimentisphaerales bacterium]HRV47514.1 phosphoribosylglycinamide formyltransferase [Sedimentisphaerales bacterium]
MSVKLTVHTDGGSRGNPGPAAAGFVLDDSDGRRRVAKAHFLGESTNNVAEYTALIRALQAAARLGAAEITVFSDSELLVRQINGRYKVKSDLIRPLYDEAQALMGRFKACEVRHVRREENKDADRLVNLALDAERDIDETPGAPSQACAAPSDSSGRFLRLGFLISGSGRTMTNILDEIRKGRLNAQISIVISSRSTVAGVTKARDAGLPLEIVRKKDYPDIDAFSQKIEDILVAAKVDLVVQGGWLCLWKIPQRYENRVLNIHPALLPSFGGQGMWGHHVHEAVLAAGCKVSGCTVHFCTNEYDNGPIVVQRTCPVLDDDTPDTLADRVFEQECIAYPEAIRLFAQGRLRIEGRRVRVIP